MKRFISAVAFIASLALVGWGYYVGRAIPFASQWPLYEALRSTASIIFAVIGAWFAIIYPDKLRALKSAAPDDSSEQPGMSRLFTPIVHSTVILSVILIIGVVAPLLARSTWLLELKPICRGLSYATLSLLTVWQIMTVLMTLDPADSLKRNADRARKQKEAIEALTRDRQ